MNRKATALLLLICSIVPLPALATDAQDIIDKVLELEEERRLAYVGITRAGQIPTRWIDQGATQALPIARVTSRRIAGLVEVAIAAHVADKTDWRRMLRGAAERRDLRAEAGRLLADAFARLPAWPSGSFLDIRSM